MLASAALQVHVSLAGRSWDLGIPLLWEGGEQGGGEGKGSEMMVVSFK